LTQSDPRIFYITRWDVNLIKKSTLHTTKIQLWRHIIIRRRILRLYY